MSHLDTIINRKAKPNPKTGEMSSTLRTLNACSQSTPEVAMWGLKNWLARPTPMMEPTMVWELEAGNPNHHVLRFHTMAAMRSAKTMATPAPELTWRMSTTGSSVMTAKATVPVETSTPARLQIPDQTTATLGSREWV